ncbi:hypothetical protein HanRHA438_Chr08g0366671 [Helianthus annuus]|uniref:Uncharacterized protein n=1 Tax=Helianthus annuus TaxID=4232 RepID=A0A9K3IHV5_HELAN|nr:hypothetical protein HanXRQr2_Chr08g0354611 [Helianthus annuus]KAJ0548331.1 hypothetical protein HanIR_Chr08g0382551 [Helianthus annuus]KAJ0899276.1 hypothetical protein HanRHA438_Chr08g0366671 [Helianthus annuus]
MLTQRNTPLIFKTHIKRIKKLPEHKNGVTYKINWEPIVKLYQFFFNFNKNDYQMIEDTLVVFLAPIGNNDISSLNHHRENGLAKIQNRQPSSYVHPSA